jgi:hypothetical protein
MSQIHHRLRAKKEATGGTKYVRMLYLTSHSGIGSGTLTYMKVGGDEDDDGSPDVTLLPSLPKP